MKTVFVDANCRPWRVQVKHIAVAGFTVATRVVGGVNPGVYYTHGDHLGSLNVLTNDAGGEVQRLTYLPFGETLNNTGSVNFASRRYTGQIEDPETGLYFYNARYYNPALGRFLSPDSVVPEPGNSQALNRFSYVANNPVNLTDPSGHSWFSKIFKTILRVAVNIAMIAASIVAVVTQNYWALPLIVGGGSAALSALNGATGEQIILSGVVGAGAALVGMGIGSAVSGALGSAGGSPALASAGGNVTGAGAGGFVQGMGLRLALGGSWRDSVRAGYQAAAIAGGVAAIASLSNIYYEDTAGFEPDPMPGKPLEGGYYQPNRAGQPPQGYAVFGLNQELTGDFWADFWKQGGFIGRFGNARLTGNAIAAIHDAWMNALESAGRFSRFMNVASMVPALVVTEAALLSGPTASVVLMRVTREESR